MPPRRWPAQAVRQRAAEIERIWRDLLFLSHATSVGAITSLALAAIDTALWDIRCRKSGKPLHVEAGGAQASVPLYTTEGGWLQIETATLVEDALRAKAAGFDRPILHGAASFGVAARAILRTCTEYRPERLKSIEARFSRPVFPGDTIRTEIWREGDCVSFQCRVVSRNDIVLSNGLATLRA